jgi:hypothetical protein
MVQNDITAEAEVKFLRIGNNQHQKPNISSPILMIMKPVSGLLETRLLINFAGGNTSHNLPIYSSIKCKAWTVISNKNAVLIRRFMNLFVINKWPADLHDTAEANEVKTKLCYGIELL